MGDPVGTRLPPSVDDPGGLQCVDDRVDHALQINQIDAQRVHVRAQVFRQLIRRGLHCRRRRFVIVRQRQAGRLGGNVRCRQDDDARREIGVRGVRRRVGLRERRIPGVRGKVRV